MGLSGNWAVPRHKLGKQNEFDWYKVEALRATINGAERALRDKKEELDPQGKLKKRKGILDLLFAANEHYRNQLDGFFDEIIGMIAIRNAIAKWTRDGFFPFMPSFEALKDLRTFFTQEPLNLELPELGGDLSFALAVGGHQGKPCAEPSREIAQRLERLDHIYRKMFHALKLLLGTDEGRFRDLYRIARRQGFISDEQHLFFDGMIYARNLADHSNFTGEHPVDVADWALEELDKRVLEVVGPQSRMDHYGIELQAHAHDVRITACLAELREHGVVVFRLPKEERLADIPQAQGALAAITNETFYSWMIQNNPEAAGLDSLTVPNASLVEVYGCRDPEETYGKSKPGDSARRTKQFFQHPRSPKSPPVLYLVTEKGDLRSDLLRVLRPVDFGAIPWA